MKEPDEIVLPLAAEELVTATSPLHSGSVRVQTHVQKRTERVEASLLRDSVEVRRVAVNRVVTETPEVRHEGDTMIVPVMEEQLVITRQLVLKEEIHLIMRRTTEPFAEDVELHRENADVQHLDASGNVIE
jgi:uncharacterized protein (TIGR02271 family)